MCGGGGNHRWQSKSRWPAAWGAGTRWAHSPAHPSMHRQGPLRGRLVPQPWSFRAGRPECLAWFAFAGILRMLFRSALPSVAWGSAYPPAARAPRFAWAPCGRPGGRPAATLVACVRYAPAAVTVPLWSASPPFGSHRHPVSSTPLRFVHGPRRGSTRYAPCTPLRCVPVTPRPRLGGACKAGGARLSACRPGQAPQRRPLAWARFA